jgi:hypothetical protein
VYQLGQIINDRYEVSGILEPLAFGQLYRALQRRGGGHMFLWTIGPQLLPDVTWRQNVLQNLSRAYGARHPNVMQLCDLFIFRDDVVLAFQYLEGPTLAVYLEQRRAQGPMSRGEIWSLLEQAGSAVSQYHQLNMLIGAVRPEALIMTGSGVMLRDPGVALQLPRGRFLRAAKRARAWRWLAPELREKRPVDMHADVYSLAALAHLILYGSEHPWPDGSRRGLFAKVGRRLRFGARPRPPTQTYPLVDAVLKTALAGHPRARPFDVETLLQQISAALARSPDRPIAAPAPPAAIPKNAGARTVQMPASPDPAPSLPEPPVAPEPPPRPRRSSLLEAVPTGVQTPQPTNAQEPGATVFARPQHTPTPSPSPIRAPVEAPTMMATAPSPAPMRAPVEAPTMMAQAPAPARAPSAPVQAPTMMAPAARAPAPSDPDAIAIEIDAELPPPSPSVLTRQAATRQLDSNEINSLLSAEPDSDVDDKNKTREIDAAQIQALLAVTREDPPKKP